MSKFRATLHVEIKKKYDLTFEGKTNWTRFEVVDLETGQDYIITRPYGDAHFSNKKIGDRFEIEAEPAGDQKITVYVPKLRRVEIL